MTQTEITQNIGKKVDSSETLDELMQKVYTSQIEFKNLNQEQTDHIFYSASLAANKARFELAKLVIEESCMGVLEDKVIKNHFSSEMIYNEYKDFKSVGTISIDEENKIKIIVEPVGIIAGISPCTNPTSTTIFKALIALKSRNCIVFSPHPRTAKSTIMAAKIIRDAAIEAGAPKNCIGWIDVPSIELCSVLMKHKLTKAILATGSTDLVKSAYSSGKLAIGGGAGNTPVLLDETCDIQLAVNSIILSKTFDNSLICASEQTIIVMDTIYNDVIQEFKKRNVYVCSDSDEQKKIVKYLYNSSGGFNAAAVGISAEEIANIVSITIPKESKLILCEIDEIGENQPLSKEKLSPVLSIISTNSFDDGISKAIKILELGGLGHTSGIYIDDTLESSKSKIDKFGLSMPTGRILVNMPTTHGALGGLFNDKQVPSLTLGCGTWGGTSTSESIGVKHLLNYKTLSIRKDKISWFNVPENIYFRKGILSNALKDLKDCGIKKAFIVTDSPMEELGYVNKITKILEKLGIVTKSFSKVPPEPDVNTVCLITEHVKLFKPDCLIGLGGGSPLDASKLVKLMYESPDIKWNDFNTVFLDLRKRIVNIKSENKIKKFVCIPTTSGTGAEMTPFAVIRDNNSNIKYPIVTYDIVPNIAIVDSDFVKTMPKRLASVTGLDTLTHILEAYVSAYATSYTDGLCIEAGKLLFASLENSVNNPNEKVREDMHNSASIAGMAFGNAFLGVSHAIAHQLGATMHIDHGYSNALLLPHVIVYNSSEKPTKQQALPQYPFTIAKKKYSDFAKNVGLCSKDTSEQDALETLVNRVKSLIKSVGGPANLKELNIDKEEYLKNVESMALNALNDQCIGANPRFPLLEEIKDILIKIYDGNVKFE